VFLCFHIALVNNHIAWTTDDAQCLGWKVVSYRWADCAHKTDSRPRHIWNQPREEYFSCRASDKCTSALEKDPKIWLQTMADVFSQVENPWCIAMRMGSGVRMAFRCFVILSSSALLVWAVGSWEQHRTCSRVSSRVPHPGQEEECPWKRCLGGSYALGYGRAWLWTVGRIK